ncbi:MAG: Beta-lactamase class A [Lachnoclostridium sp.]|jgi:beta-lactamase class A
MERKQLLKLIEKEIQNARAKTALLVENLTTGEGLVSYCADIPVVSASMIKVPVMITALEEIQAGSLSKHMLIPVDSSLILEDTEVFEYGEKSYTLDELLVWMIINSDNTATNCLINLLSMERINRTCKRLGLKNTRLERLMLDFNAIKNGYNNYTSAFDMCTLYKALYQKTILTPELCDYAISILLRQRHKQNSMRYISNEVKVAHKTGGLDFLNHDAGIFYLERLAYYFGAFTWDGPDNEYGKKWIGRISKAVYEYYSKI